MREPLTRDRALAAAVTFADEHGIESLSMRKLAAELGVEAMSLYYHVKNKSDILDGMVDVVFGEVRPPSGELGWRAAMQTDARALREALARHPWAIALLDSRSQPGAVHLAHLDATIGVLRADGFSLELAAHTMAVLHSYTRGFALQEQALPTDDGDMTAATEDIMAQQAMMSGAFPNLAAMASDLVLRPGYAFANEFEFGLQLILDGIGRVRSSALTAG